MFSKFFSRIFQEYCKNIFSKVVTKIVKKYMSVTHVIWFAPNYNFYFVLEDGNVVILILYVDDLIITKNNNTSKINWIKKQHESGFEMTNLGKYKLYLGVEFLMMEKGIFMSQ